MSTPCSMALLESALVGELSPDVEASLHQHVQDCEHCSVELERLAGGAAWRREAASLLVEDEFDAAASPREDWSDVDFTVEHLEPAEEPNVLGRLGGYDVLEIIGRGGMGVVLKGFDRELKRCVAIKVLSPHLAQSSLAKKRFAREAQAAAAVVHPNILAIHQVQPNGRLPFLVMPMVAGESLAQRLATQGTLDLKETLRIGMQAAAGLAAAHEQGLVHRDVKPANILLERGIERAVLMDFGLARAADDVTLTRWGIIAGTPQYMSPEQARGEPLDARSDLFSLGCVLYEMATGVSPFRADSVVATLRRLVDDQPQAMRSLNPELPPWFIAIVERLLEKDPSRRFDSAQEVSDLLEACLAHVQQPGIVPLPAVLARRPVRTGVRPILLSFKGVLAMMTVLATGLLGAWLLFTAPPDIAGEWQGEGWGDVVLKKTDDKEYTGTFTDPHNQQRGEIHLAWSAMERRFNGTWREGEKRSGKISVRLVGDEIRGAHTTTTGTENDPGSPRLSDLAWTKARTADTAAIGEDASPTLGPVVEHVLVYDDTENGASAFFDIDKNQAGAMDLDKEQKAIFLWARDKGMDLEFSGFGARTGLRGWRMRVADADESEWAAITAEDVITDFRLANATRASRSEEGALQPASGSKADVFPAPQLFTTGTYFFRTDENNHGILQVSVNDQPHGIKIRYRKVVPHQNSGAAVANVIAESPAQDMNDASAELPRRLLKIPTKERVGGIACSPDGKLIAISNGSRPSPPDPQWRPSVEILDAATGGTIASVELTAEEEALLPDIERLPYFGTTALAFSPNSDVLAVGSGLGVVKLVNARTGEMVHVLNDPEINHAEMKMPENLRTLKRVIGMVNSLAFSPDGRLLALCGASLRDMTRRSVDIHPFAPDVTTGRLQIWDLATYTRKADLAGNSFVSSMSFSPEGTRLASTGLRRGEGEGGGGGESGVFLWNPQTGERTRMISAGGNLVNYWAMFAPDGKHLLTWSYSGERNADTSISLVDLRSGQIQWTQSASASSYPRAFSRDGRSIAILQNGKSILFLDTATGRPITTGPVFDSQSGEKWTDFVIAPRGHVLAIGGNDADGRGFVEIWNFHGPVEAKPSQP